MLQATYNVTYLTEHDLEFVKLLQTYNRIHSDTDPDFDLGQALTL